MSAVHDLKRRAVRLRVQLAMIKRKIAALEAFRGFCNDDSTVADRIDALLGENPDMVFTPAEIMEACRATEDATRRSLWLGHRAGRFERVRHGRYQAVRR